MVFNMSKEIPLNDKIIFDFKRKYEAIQKPFPGGLKLILMILVYIIGSKGFRSVFFYRLIKNSGFVRPLLIFIRWLTFCVEIPHSADIGEGFLIGHPDGVIINGNCVIGKNFTIQQEVTLGGNMRKRQNGKTAPTIGDDVFVGPGAKILGPVKIGNGCIIGSNSVVLKDIPERSLVFGIPGVVVKKVEKTYIEIEREHTSKPP